MVFPVIAPAVAGKAVTVTLRLEAALLEQLLLATTETVPPVALAVAVIVFEVEVPVHPAGNVHVYDVAPETNATLYV